MIKEICCVIPVKKNSRRLKNKNFLVINKKSLFEIALKKSISSKLFRKIYVSSDSERVEKLCKELLRLLPKNQETVYLTNSGTEAIEGAIKLAKKATGREELISAFNSYHGSTHGSLSLQVQVIKRWVMAPCFLKLNLSDLIMRMI